jgi:hypothetical protein
MKVLSTQDLVDTVRELAEKAEKRLWIAVPYIGTYQTVQEILGSSWLKKHKISFKLLTDVNELNRVSASSIMSLKKRGLILSLAGLHAKIYVIDDNCIIGSANLTRTSFTKRYEGAILLSPNESHKAISLFESFWGKGKSISDAELIQIQKGKGGPQEDEGIYNGLATLSKLHQTSLFKEEDLGKQYLSYTSIVEQFKDFAKKYQNAIGKRLWQSVPIYYEVDCFLDYLFAHAAGKPSHPYKYLKGRNLTVKQQINILQIQINLFKEYIEEKNIKPKNYRDATVIFKRNLSKKNYNKLSWAEIKRMLWHTNSGSSQPINISKITNPNNNNLSTVRTLLYQLVNSDEQLESRMHECSKIFGIGKSLMNETLHFYNPTLYPLINLRSCSGLRYFGYQINEHRDSKK